MTRPAGAHAPAEQGYRSGLWRLAAPLVVSFTVRESLQLVDMAYAATFEGKDAAIAAIGLTSPYWLLLLACWVGTSNGLTAHFAAALGAREGRRIEQLLRATRAILVALSIAFLAIALSIWWSAPPPGRDPLLHENFRIYGSVLIGGMALTTFWSVLPDSIVKAHHDTKSTMWAGLLSAFTNVILNTLFVFAFHWGIFGIALATVLSRIASLAYALARARQHERARRQRGEDSAPGAFGSAARAARAVGALALPAALTFALMALEAKLLYSQLERLGDSVAAIAAWAVFDRSVRFASMPMIALGVAMLPLVARLWGQGRREHVRTELRAANRMLWIYGLVLVPLFWALAPALAAGLAGDPAGRAYATFALRVAPLGVLASSPSFYLRAAFEGMQRPQPGLVAAIARTALFVVPLFALGLRLAERLGQAPIHGAVAGYVAGSLAATLLLAAWYWLDARRASPAARGAG